MKSTGIIRNIDELGRIVVPKEFRKKLDIQNNDPVEISAEGDRIILQKFTSSCVFCGGDRGIREFKGKKICSNCLNNLRGLL